MSDSTKPAEQAARRVPVRLGRRHDDAMDRMVERALPDELPRLELAAFNSSI